MAARLFTCHHIVPERVFRPNRLFTMLVSGVRSDEQAGQTSDHRCRDHEDDGVVHALREEPSGLAAGGLARGRGDGLGGARGGRGMVTVGVGNAVRGVAEVVDEAAQ